MIRSVNTCLNCESLENALKCSKHNLSVQIDNVCEDHSIKKAFSKMSDEVNNLIDMKTADAITARDEAMDAKEQTGRFFNNMSHELRTPLNAIIGYSEILYEDCEDEGYDDLMPDLSKITNSGKHLLELVNEILDIGKIQSGKMEFFAKSFDLGETLDMVRDISSPLADDTFPSIPTSNSIVTSPSILRRCADFG
mgnify:CR=1 FL=1